MDIKFNNNKLKKYANNDSLANRKLGTIRAKLYKARLDDLHDAESLEELKYVPGNYHELTQDRKGQWACDLDQPYRLIFVPQENPIPIDEDGKYIWIEIKGVEIIEVINYHKER
jgi:proteic killer suppression protein